MRNEALLKVRKEIEAEALRYIETAQTFLAQSADEGGLSKNDLAALTGLSLRTVQAAFRKGSRPNSYTFGMIAGAIGVQVKVPKNGIDVRAPRAKAGKSSRT